MRFDADDYAATVLVRPLYSEPLTLIFITGTKQRASTPPRPWMVLVLVCLGLALVGAWGLWP